MSTQDQMIERGHERVAFHQDPQTNLRAIIAVHSTQLGPGFGGIRRRHYATEADAIWRITVSPLFPKLGPVFGKRVNTVAGALKALNPEEAARFKAEGQLSLHLDGEAVACDGEVSITTMSCCDVWGNADGDWTDCIAAYSGMIDNFSLDTLLCDPAGDDFHLQAGSPCVPGANPICGLIGAWGEGCGRFGNARLR